MKKSILLTSLLIFLFVGSSFADSPDLFSYDKSLVQTEMASLTDLEQYIMDNPGITLTALKEAENPIASSVSGTNYYSTMSMFEEKALGIGGFWWGCCLGPAGILVVYLVTEDKEETRSSIIGCVVNGIIQTVAWLVYYLAILDGYYYY